MKKLLRSIFEENPARFRSNISPPSSKAIVAGNIDVANRPVVRNPNGQLSTVRSMSFEREGREILVPTVSADGRLLSNEEAIKEYDRTGQHLGIFASPKEATEYAKRLHIWYEKQGAP